MSNLLQRTLTGIVFGFLVLGSIYLGPIYQTFVFGFFMVVGLWEFYRFFEQDQQIEIDKYVGIVAGILTYFLLIGISARLIPPVFTSFLLPLLFAIFLVQLWKNKKNPILNIGLLFLGQIYVVLPFYLSIDLNLRDDSFFPIVSGMFIMIWVNDTFAYFTGRFFGKRKLFERVSPNKTWEGAFGGVIFTLAVGFILGNWIYGKDVWFWFIAALIVAPCSIFGDLVESLFKRSRGVKDSGNLLPGHGGVLDRFDAVLLVVPFFYCWYLIYQLL